jgi:hypothetical protein
MAAKLISLITKPGAERHSAHVSAGARPWRGGAGRGTGAAQDSLEAAQRRAAAGALVPQPHVLLLASSLRAHLSTHVLLGPHCILSCAQVDELLQVQQRLKAVVLAAPTIAPAGDLDPLAAASATVGTAKAETADAKVAELRQLLGKAVRAQTEQQHDIDRFREALREEQTGAVSERHAANVAASEAQQLRKEVDELRSQLAEEQRERMESEAAALEREEQLEARVQDLVEADQRRLALEKAMAEVEPPPASAPPSIQVSAPPPAPPSAGFDVSAGGFSL